MKKMNVSFLAALVVAGSVLVGCSSADETTTKSNYTGAEGTEKTISDGGDVPVQGTTDQKVEYIDHTRDANPPGDSVAPGDTIRK